MGVQIRQQGNNAHLPIILMILFLALALVTGGATRADVVSLLVLRPAAIAVAALALVLMPPERLSDVRTPLALLGALAVLMAFQLTPLPPALWTNLPWRDQFQEIAVVAGQPQPWRSLTISPMRTMNSLMSLIVPVAVLAIFAWLRTEQRFRLLPWLIAFGFASGFLGLLQLLGPAEGPLYFYRITNHGSAVGFFANRNHQASLLACLLPMLTVFATMGGTGTREHRLRSYAALGCGLFVMVLILATGSRAGFLLMLVGLLASALLLRGSVRSVVSSARGHHRRGYAILSILVLLVVVFFLLPESKTVGITRSLNTNVFEELRANIIRPTIAIIVATFPFGSGFGTFETAFRIAEPHDFLAISYVNHAHNDVLELVSDSGLAGIAILLAFLLLWIRAGWRAWTARDGSAPSVRFARLGSVITLMLMLASLVDYPLRGPFLASLFAIAIGWMFARAPVHNEAESGDASQRRNG